MDTRFYRAWAEVDLDNVIHNLNEVKRVISKKTIIMGVVKADAYGHGVEQIAGLLLENGVSRLAVATLDEAIQLRRKGFDNAAIQVLSHTFPLRVKEIFDYDIIQTVFDIDLAEELSAEAEKRKVKIKIHIKVDTGMSRLGFQAKDAVVKKIAEIYKMPCLEIEGLMTHFASSDDKNGQYTSFQMEQFTDICSGLKKEGIHIPIKHVSNSAAIINYREIQMDMVRPGIMLYGLYPSEKTNRSVVHLKPAMSLKANIINVNCLPENTCISYGMTFRTARESRVITLPLGYADGYPTLLSNKSRILVGGEYAPVVGRVCMDHCMADVTDIKKEIHTGDEAVLFGKQGNNAISIEETAEKSGAISYEVVCRIGNRIPRVYIKNGNYTLQEEDKEINCCDSTIYK